MLEVIFLKGFLLITPSAIARKFESFERNRKNRRHTKQYVVCIMPEGVNPDFPTKYSLVKCRVGASKHCQIPHSWFCC